MDETEWDLQEMKSLKIKHLVLYNLVMLLLVVWFGIYAENEGTAPLLFGLYCVLFWIILANMLYTLMTEKAIGTKSMQRVLAFDIDHMGKKRWKQKKTLDAVIISVISIVVTVVLLAMGYDSVRLEFPDDVIPFIGAWVGYNYGEISNINRL